MRGIAFYVLVLISILHGNAQGHWVDLSVGSSISSFDRDDVQIPFLMVRVKRGVDMGLQYRRMLDSKLSWGVGLQYRRGEIEVEGHERIFGMDVPQDPRDFFGDRENFQLSLHSLRFSIPVGIQYNFNSGNVIQPFVRAQFMPTIAELERGRISSSGPPETERFRIFEGRVALLVGLDFAIHKQVYLSAYISGGTELYNRVKDLIAGGSMGVIEYHHVIGLALRYQL